MSAYRPQSWGRTRRPKELEPKLPFDGTYDPTDPTRGNVGIAAAPANLNAALNDATEANNGYCTENQRFLHVYVKGAAATDNAIDIYCYNYAFREWGPLYVKKPNASGYEVANATEPSMAGYGAYYVFDIAGIDRVAFVKSTSSPPTRVRAACSTF